MSKAMAMALAAIALLSLSSSVCSASEAAARRELQMASGMAPSAPPPLSLGGQIGAPPIPNNISAYFPPGFNFSGYVPPGPVFANDPSCSRCNGVPSDAVPGSGHCTIVCTAGCCAGTWSAAKLSGGSGSLAFGSCNFCNGAAAALPPSVLLAIAASLLSAIVLSAVAY